MYDVALKRKWDQHSILTTAKLDGRREGLAEGEARGLAKGEARGLAKGLAKAKYEVVLNADKEGIPVKTIASLTGLTVKEVKDILKNNAAGGL